MNKLLKDKKKNFIKTHNRAPLILIIKNINNYFPFH